MISEMAYCRGVTCDGLTSRPGGVEILVAVSCYRNRDMPLGSKASRFFFLALLQTHKDVSNSVARSILGVHAFNLIQFLLISSFIFCSCCCCFCLFGWFFFLR